MQFQYITTNPKILGGKPIIKGTRMSVQFILELVASGGSVKEIVKKYPHLNDEAVREAILFAIHNLRNDVVLEVAAPAA
jgi:uncharacterized protein (DUF433 family)